jgi:hypothetical protein
MRYCLAPREPLHWIKVRQTTNKIFEVCINVRPWRERLPRVSLIEAVPNNVEDLAPRAVAKMLQEPTQSVFIRKIGDLALEDDR